MAVTEGAESTGRPSDRRKLIAVLYADMVGYSRLIGLDDAGTLDRLRTLRSDLIYPAIDEHGGRIVQTGGDSLLIVFDSIDGAVRCAVRFNIRFLSMMATNLSSEPSDSVSGLTLAMPSQTGLICMGTR